MAQQEPKVLTFDVVGTLIDFETGMLGFLRGACGEAAAKLDDDTILAAYRASRASKAATRFPDDLVRVYTETAPRLGLPHDKAIAEGFRDFDQAMARLPGLGAGAEAAAEALQAGGDDQCAALVAGAHGAYPGGPVRRYRDVDEALCEKPDPKFFAFTRGRLSRDGHGLHDILHVAQSQYHDIGVARQLGYTVCWIERRKGLKGFGGTLEVAELTKPDYHFTTLAELADAAEAGALQIRAALG